MIQQIEGLKLKIIFPDGYNEEEQRTKEWLSFRVELENGKLYEIIIITILRLGQESNYFLESNICYYEPNLIIVPEVTMKIVKKVVQYLYETDKLKSLSDYKSSWEIIIK